MVDLLQVGRVTMISCVYSSFHDCAIYVFPQLQPVLPTILEVMLTQLDVDTVGYDAETGFAVVNNACWSLGEIAIKQEKGLTDYVDRFLQKLGAILYNQKIPESLNDNAAIAIGRLGIGNPEKIAPHLAAIAPLWLQAMSRQTWTEEKGDAFWGFNLSVLQNPQAMESSLLQYFSEVATVALSILAENADVRRSFQQVIAQYRSMMDLDAYLRQLPPAKQQTLLALSAP